MNQTTSKQEAAPSLGESIQSLAHPRVVAMLFLGFSAGLPILLIFSSLSLWLREAGLAKSAVTFFSWAALGYSFKFIWAPLVDRLPLPFLGNLLGRRRSWLLCAQVAVSLAIIAMAMTDPVAGDASLRTMALAAVALGFSSATQDIVIDAYRIESAGKRLQALLSSSYIAGYRIGMLVAGAGALFMAESLGSTKDSYSYAAWQSTYLAMAACMVIGIVTTLVIKEPDTSGRPAPKDYAAMDYIRFLALFAISVLVFVGVFFMSAEIAAGLKKSWTDALSNRVLAGTLVAFIRLVLAVAAALGTGFVLASLGLVKREMLMEIYVDPVRDFFRRYGLQVAFILLALIACYRISDIVLGVISNVFYQDIGFDKKEIAFAVKTWGLIMTIVGGFVGGILAMRYGVMRVLFLGAVLSAVTNLLFMWLATAGRDMTLLYVVISADNLSAGIATAAFVAFLSSLTSISFTAIQYAIFSSVMTLVPKLLGGYSGSMVEAVGYPQFFFITTLLGLPALFLVWLASVKLPKD